LFDFFKKIEKHGHISEPVIGFLETILNPPGVSVPVNCPTLVCSSVGLAVEMLTYQTCLGYQIFLEMYISWQYWYRVEN
jgi:hypothetical protein